MATDPRNLRPVEIVRLMNSTPLGEVLSDRQLFRHRQRAGYRIGRDRTIDLYRYVAWLYSLRHADLRLVGPTGYDALREQSRSRNVTLSLSGRDIAPLPEVADPERRAAALASFQVFCETYFAAAFTLAWSPDHLKAMAKIERAVLEGELFAHAMPRGSGKTTLATVACIWAVLTGERRFVCLIAASADRAKSLLATIKTFLEVNELLAQDFPEVIYPVHKLGRIVNRQAGQLFEGQPTRIEWSVDRIVLPTIPGSAAGGAVISTSGMKGSDIRGQHHVLADGAIIRPDLTVIDDPQTTESARSRSQCQEREAIVAGDILGMAGPGKKIAGIMCCTVIRPDDMADRILNRELHPEWYGERTKLIYRFPPNEELWAKYAEIRRDSLRNGGDGATATEFYCQNQAAMDAGAEVAWPERFNDTELSAVQHAMNLRLERGDVAFFSEYQNEPLPEITLLDDELTADEIAAKLNRLPRCSVPLGANHVTAFIDIQGAALYYVVAAWSDAFDGYVLDYGTYPDQKREYFTLRDVRLRLLDVAPGTGLEAAIYDGLDTLTKDLCGRQWRREDGAALRIEKCLIDANWGTSTDLVYMFCSKSPHAAVLTPSHGRYIGASSRPMAEYDRRPGERVGNHWRMPAVEGGRQVRHVAFDANFYKSFIHARLAVALGDSSSLTLFGTTPEQHRMFAEQLTAEYRVPTEGRGRKVDEWKQRPGQDNHFFDCIVGCAVAASMQGAALENIAVPYKPRKRVSMAEMQREARRRQGLR